jgi:hypothetical protein
MCGSNNIIVNCGCCNKKSNGESSIEDVLFDGVANTVGAAYKLQKSITDYRELIVEYGRLNKGSWVKSYGVIPNVNKVPADMFEKIVHIHFKDSALLRWFMNWHFTDELTFSCDYIAKSENSTTLKNVDGEDTSILKIIGIK